MNLYNEGDRVQWTSQAGGSPTTKTGTVVKVVFEGCKSPRHLAKRYFPDHKIMFDGLGIPGGGSVCYLVEVIVSPRAKKRIYLPYPNALQKVRKPDEPQELSSYKVGLLIEEWKEKARESRARGYFSAAGAFEECIEAIEEAAGIEA